MAWAISIGAWRLAGGIFVLAVVSDILDGVVARRLDESSPLGGLLDHASDACFVTVALATLAFIGLAPAWLPLLVAASFIQYVLDSKALAGRQLRASMIGRNNGVAYFVAVGIPVIGNALDLDWPPVEWVLGFGWLLVATTVVSMLDRLRALVARK